MSEYILCKGKKSLCFTNRITICGLIIGDSIIVLIPFTIGLVVPVIFMICYHKKLIKKYYIC